MRKRLTYANVAATLALMFSMTGGAIAANHYLINSTKQINPKVLKKLKGATGATGQTGPQGLQGPVGKEGAPGKTGNQGAAGSALAYAHILPGGAFDASLSKNVSASNITRESNGFYCVHGLPFTVNNIEATIDYDGTNNGEIPLIFVKIPGSGICSGGTANPQAGIFEGKNLSSSVTLGVDDGFYLVIN